MFTVTFYSYKGGVGRTMALANTAYRLRAKGKTVFVLDFDLEAPGFGAFFGDESKQPGLVEYVTQYLEQGTVPPLEGFVCELPRTAEEGHRRGNIYCMRAGRADSKYQELLARLNWKNFYSQSHGFLFVENLKGAIQKAYSPDYVLVDSRTGLTDISGICTLQLPNLVVFLFALNRQNVEGIANIYKSVAQNKLNRPIDTLLVASPVPDLPSYVGLKQQRIAKATERLGHGIDLMLPFAPFAAFEEAVLAPNSGTHLGEAYDALTDRIIDLNKGDVLTLLNEVKTLQKEGDLDRTEAKYQQILEGFPHTPEVWHSYGIFLRASRKAEEASQAFFKAIELRGGASNYAELALTLLTTGDVHGAKDNFYKFLQHSSRPQQIWKYTQSFDSRGELEPAIAGYKRMLEVCRPDDRTTATAALHRLGNIYMQKDDPKQASEFYRKFRDLQPNELPSTFNLGFALHRSGERTEARLNLDRATQIYEQMQTTLSLPAYRANMTQAMGQAYFLLDNLDKAEANLLSALDISEKLSSNIFSSVQYKDVSPEEFARETRRLLEDVKKRKLQGAT